MEGRKTDKTGLEKAERIRREEGKKETDNRESKNNKKNNGRKGERRGRFDKVESNRQNGSKTVS